MLDETRLPGADGKSTLGRRFVGGAVFGAGFSLVFVTCLVIGITILVNTVTPPSQSRDASIHFKQFGPGAKLVIASQEPHKTKSNLSILGTVRNDGPDPWQFIRFQVNLLATDGRLVGLCEGASSSSVYPGHSRAFQVECRGTEDKPLPQYDRYTLEIVEASYVWTGT